MRKVCLYGCVSVCLSVYSYDIIIRRACLCVLLSVPLAVCPFCIPIYICLFYFEVVGCADLDAPEGGWVKRTADSMTVGCHGRPTTWHLTCNGITWAGDIGRCRNPLGSLGQSITQ